MGLNTSKYNVTNKGGAGGMWRESTAMLGDGKEALLGWGNMLIYGGVVAIGGVLLLIAYSFANGKQDLAASIKAGGDIAKMAATKGAM